jgi:hypothetical protein
MTTLTFIRHAQSQNNATNISEVDTPLSQLGISQASKLHGNYDLVVISPLTRTLQTFRHSHIFAPRIIISDLVREWKLDLCDFKLDEMVRFETIEELDSRIEKFKIWIKNLCDRFPDYTKIAIFTHYDFVWHLTKYKVDHIETDSTYFTDQDACCDDDLYFGKGLDNATTHDVLVQDI